MTGLGLTLLVVALALAVILAATGDGAGDSPEAAVAPLYPVPYVVVYGRQVCSLTPTRPIGVAASA